MERLNVLLLHGTVVCTPIADYRRIFSAALFCAIHHACTCQLLDTCGILNTLPGAWRVLQGFCVRRLIVTLEHVILSVAALVGLRKLTFGDGICLRCGVRLSVISWAGIHSSITAGWAATCDTRIWNRSWTWTWTGSIVIIVEWVQFACLSQAEEPRSQEHQQERIEYSPFLTSSKTKHFEIFQVVV